MSTTETQWGVRHKDGRIEHISEASANEGYMTAQEYATVRADVTGGKVVKRTKQIIMGDWKPGRRKPVKV